MIIIRIILIALSFSGGYASASNSWYFDKAINGVEFWKHPEMKDARIVLERQAVKSPTELKYYQSKEFTETFQARKRMTLSFFSITEWTVTVESVKKVGADVVVDFSGSYLDRISTKVTYRERHFYGPNQVIQLLFTAPVMSKPESATVLRGFDEALKARP